MNLLDPFMTAERKSAAEAERATIVAWMRKKAGSYLNDVRKSCLLEQADALERGDHLKDRPS